MVSNNISPKKSALVMFLATFGLGLALFLVFSWLAGVFAPGGFSISTFRDSPSGWAALFGATVMLASPFVAVTVLFLDRVAKSIVEREQGKQKK